MFPMDTVQCPPLDPGAPVDCVESAAWQITSILPFPNNSSGFHLYCLKSHLTKVTIDGALVNTKLNDLEKF